MYLTSAENLPDCSESDERRLPAGAAGFDVDDGIEFFLHQHRRDDSHKDREDETQYRQIAADAARRRQSVDSPCALDKPSKSDKTGTNMQSSSL